MLARPAVGARHALDLCIASIQDLDLTRRLGLVSATIEAAELEYMTHGEQATLYHVAGSEGVSGQVTTAEMERVYRGTFVRSARTRNIYDTLKKLPKNDVCPLCSQRTVSSLDHYLPQSSHPVLTVTAVNLVPACFECNKRKLALVAAEANQQTLHPYFDDVDAARWLFATVEERSPAALVFEPRPPDAWSEVMRARVGAHFRIFGLGQLYASHAAVELGNVRYRLQQMSVASSPEQISEHLHANAVSCAAAHINSWQHATYAALSESRWFCAGGFN